MRQIFPHKIFIYEIKEMRERSPLLILFPITTLYMKSGIIIITIVIVIVPVIVSPVIPMNNGEKVQN